MSRIAASAALLFAVLCAPALAKPVFTTLPALLEPPGPAGDLSVGSPDAAVTVVEYTSILCVYCRRFHQDVMPTVEERYIATGKVRWIVREMPLRPSENKVFAFARCLGPEKRQSLLRTLFARQPDLMALERGGGDLVPALEFLGFRRAEVDRCADDRPIMETVLGAASSGRRFGVEGTPVFFVNGDPVIGAAPLTPFLAILDAAGAN